MMAASRTLQIDSTGALGAHLMPEDEIKSYFPSRPDWPTLFRLKKEWQVSLRHC
ncbi:MAG: hypothetical protein ACJ74U_04680 [Jatrophihabitantaceae bacterium]